MSPWARLCPSVSRALPSWAEAAEESEKGTAAMAVIVRPSSKVVWAV